MAGIERMTTGSVVKSLTLSRHTRGQQCNCKIKTMIKQFPKRTSSSRLYDTILSNVSDT